jgi:starch-binding outer membrane protein, SusD/RagB family
MKKLVVYIFLSGFIGLTGCKKFLEKEPDNRTTPTSPEQVTQLLVTAYPKASYLNFAESMSDNAEDKGTGFGGLDPESPKVNQQSFLFQDVQSTDLDSPEFYFQACYKAIAAANEALEIIGNASNQNDFRPQKGEALVARAYAHFMLVTFFSKAYDPATAATDPGIPYVLTPEKEVFAKYERKTVQFVYDMIEKDLTEGLTLIEDRIYGDASKFHFTQKAARAFAARFYLFKRDYAKVITNANLAVTGDVAANLRPWNTRYTNLQVLELQTAYTKSDEPANILLQEANSVWGRSYAAYRYGMYTNVFNFLRGSTPVGGQFAIGFNVYGTPEFYNVPKFDEFFKYASANANFGDPYNMVPLFSAEEVIFNRAEANARLGNNNAALTDLNAWLSQNILNYDASTHNLTTTKAQNFYGGTASAALVSAVLHFKRISYIHEGMRWLDILRLKLPVTHRTISGQTLTLTGDDKRKLLQLPSEVTKSGVQLNPR